MGTQAKLEKKLREALAPFIDTDSKSITFNLTAARGRWTHASEDVMQFKGSILIDGGYAFTIGSWESMTKCLRHGFTIIDNRRASRGYAQFIVEAKTDTSTEWYSGVQLEEITYQATVKALKPAEYRSALGKTIKRK